MCWPVTRAALTDTVPERSALRSFSVHEESMAPVAVSMTTVPTCSSPLTRVKSPTASRRAPGSSTRSLTWLLKAKDCPFHSPDDASKPARPEVCAFVEPTRATPVKLPPTYMVEPTCSKAWTWALPSA